MIQGKLDLCVSQVREGWTEMETSLGQKTWLPLETSSWRVLREEGCTSSWQMEWEYVTSFMSHSYIQIFSFMFNDWISFGLISLFVFGRVSLWKARRISRRSWANNCCSVSSLQRSLLSGQVSVHSVCSVQVRESCLLVENLAKWTATDVFYILKQKYLCVFIIYLCFLYSLCIFVSIYRMIHTGTVSIHTGTICLLQVATLSVRLLTSSLASVWVWSTCSTSVLTGSLSSNLSPAGLPTQRGGAASVHLCVLVWLICKKICLIVIVVS